MICLPRRSDLRAGLFNDKHCLIDNDDLRQLDLKSGL